MAQFHSFVWLNHIPLYTHQVFFIHSSPHGHLDCFCVLATMIMLQRTLGYMCLFELWFSQGICLVVGLLDHMVVLLLVFKGTSVLLSLMFVSVGEKRGWDELGD